MSVFVDMILSWPPQLQCQFLMLALAIACATLCILASLCCRVVKVVLRGWPIPPVVDQGNDCGHDDNLTGKCLKVAHCRTFAECHKAVMDATPPACKPSSQG